VQEGAARTGLGALLTSGSLQQLKAGDAPLAKFAEADSRRHSDISVTLDSKDDGRSSVDTPLSFAAAAAATLAAAATSTVSPRRGSRSGHPRGTLHAVELEWELTLKNEASHSSQVISLALVYATSKDGSAPAAIAARQPCGMIANVSGHLLLYSHEAADESGVAVSAAGGADAEARNGGGALGPPALLATGVENFWVRPPSDTVRLERHLDEALWLGCGAFGMKVWLPLYPTSDQDRSLPKRVMLPFAIDIYPLSVLLADAVVLGASHDAVDYRNHELPFFAVVRKTQPYLHHILRQLLRRNEDGHARCIAKSCSHLPYFPHVLELMLHKVVEDERGEHEGESDAQLSRVSSFLEGFPFFLETVVHCARKSDVAKWGKLFAATGSAEELFERCIVTGQLHTASSYLLVLQSLQSPAASQLHALRILRLALNEEKWALARDLVRFLQATAGYVPITEHEMELVKKVEVSGQKDSFHAALQDHALTALRQHRLRALGQFAAALHFPLLRWLRSVRPKEGLTLDVMSALEGVLSDFGEGAGQLDKLHHRAEAVYLLNLVYTARYLDWAFLLATLLLDKRASTKILEEVALDAEAGGGVFGIMKRFKCLVDHPRLSAAHTALYSELASSFRPAMPAATDLERERPLSPPEPAQCRIA